MKKTIAIILTLALILSFAACGKKADSKTIKVGASITPHAEILREAAKILEKQGIKLEVVEYTDYVQPNTAVEDGSLDANYFQHTPYLNTFNAENKTHIVSVGAIHYEPFGIYAGKVKALSDLPDGAKIGVPNDGSTAAGGHHQAEGRHRRLLQRHQAGHRGEPQEHRDRGDGGRSDLQGSRRP